MSCRAALIALLSTFGLAVPTAYAERPTSEARDPAPGRELVGTIRRAGDRNPVSEARVLVIPAPEGLETGPLDRPHVPSSPPPWQRTTLADDAGEFRVDVPGGKVILIVLAAGFERHDEVVEVIEVPHDKPLKVFLRPMQDDPYRTVVRSSAESTRSEIGTHTLEPEEIRTLPGTQGDPLRALQNLPGVARAPGSLGVLVLRGAPPDQSGVFVGGHRVPRAFHVLALSSVIPAELIERMHYQPSNFDAAYGDRTGGIVVLDPREGRDDGFHGHAELDLAGVAASVEGPLGEGSFIVAGQRSYIDAILAGASAIQERTVGQGNDTLRPSYYDYQGIFAHPVSRRGRVSLTLLGAGDRIRTAPPDPDDRFAPSEIEFRNDFHRIDLRYVHAGPRTEFLVTPSFRYEVAKYGSRDAGAIDSVRRDFITSFRAEVRHWVTRRFWLTLGTDFEIDPIRTERVTVPLASDVGAPAQTERASGLRAHLGAYSTARLRLGRLTLEPGMRASAFILDGASRSSVDPRVNLRFEPTSSWELFAGVGKYTMLRDDGETRQRFLIGQGQTLGGGRLRFPPSILALNPMITIDGGQRSIGLRQALHLSGGASYRWGDVWSVRGSAFWREQDDGTPLMRGEDVVGFASRSRAWGLEAMIRRRLADRVYAWASYTLMWSRRSFEDAEGIVTVPSDFDLRHNFALLASYVLPKRWQIGARFRLSSGYPYTPFVGSGRHGPFYYGIPGETNSARFGVFHQLDIRIDKRWILDRTIVTGYLDVQNVYNAQNPEAAFYTVDYRRQVDTIGIPIFPTIGVRVDF